VKTGEHTVAALCALALRTEGFTRVLDDRQAVLVSDFADDAQSGRPKTVSEGEPAGRNPDAAAKSQLGPPTSVDRLATAVIDS